jgi:peptidoglycan/LPS O-acetylase OafA/YrhL
VVAFRRGGFLSVFSVGCAFIRPGKVLVVILLGFVLVGPLARTVLAHGNEVWKEYSYLGGMDAIALGSLTAPLLSRFRLPLRTFWVTGSIGTSLLILILAFSLRVEAWGFRAVLDMTIISVGACMVIATVTQARWKSPRWTSPLPNLGRRSYEVDLTHMFVVSGLFQFFVIAGKPLIGVPILFLVVIFSAGALGEVVALSYSEPLNQLIRKSWGGVAKKLPPSAIPKEASHTEV